MEKQNEKIKNHPDQEVRDIAEDLDKVTALSVVAESEGGKLLVSGLIECHAFAYLLLGTTLNELRHTPSKLSLMPVS